MIEERPEKKDHRIPLYVLAVCSVLAMPMVIIFLNEYVHSMPDSASMLVKGHVVERNTTIVYGVFKRPVLTVQVDNSEDRVKALLMSDATTDISDDVSFYFNGYQGREVFLQEETNPIFIVVLFLGAIGVTILVFLYERYRRRKPW